jgi:hypothetical protein
MKKASNYIIPVALIALAIVLVIYDSHVWWIPMLFAFVLAVFPVSQEKK